MYVCMYKKRALKGGEISSPPKFSERFRSSSTKTLLALNNNPAGYAG